MLVSFTNLAFSEIVVPEANKAAKNLLIETSAKHKPKLQNNVFVPELEHGTLKRIYYVERLKGNIMYDVIVQEFSNGKLTQIIIAKEAMWKEGQDEWLFKDGRMYPISDTGEFKHFITFKEQSIAIKYSPADFLLAIKIPMT